MSGQAQAKRGTFVGEVRTNRKLCAEHYLITIAVEAFPPTRAGQFVQLQCRPVREQASNREVEWGKGNPPALSQPELVGEEPMLRRPFSLAGRRTGDDGCVQLDVIYRAVGVGTRWLCGVAPGTKLSVLGPLGNAFRVVNDKKVVALVGGGVGIPPLLYLAEELAKAGKKVFAFCGVRSSDLLPLSLADGVLPLASGEPNSCVIEFADRGANSAIATDDGSLGYSGLVSDAFASWLEGNMRYSHAVVVYSCGPEAMMRAVAETCVPRRIDCQLALERHMACGMGTCQSCVVKIRDDSKAGWSYKLCCTDGPVFDAQDVVWQ